MSSEKLVTTSAAGQAPAGQAPPAAPPQQAGSLRLMILLGLLALVIGAYAYDYFVAKSACDAADKKIQAFVDTQNKKGIKDGNLVTDADVHKELGMQPTDVEKHDAEGYMVEYYRWWGHVPLINQRRHFISVVYIGPQHRFSSHHRENPPEEALPTADKPPPPDDGPPPTPQAAGIGGPKTDEPPAKSDSPPAADQGDKADSKSDESGAAAEKKT